MMSLSWVVQFSAHLTACDHYGQTIPTYIWVIMGVLGAAMLAIVIGLTAAAALQANNASTTPRSIIDQVTAA